MFESYNFTIENEIIKKNKQLKLELLSLQNILNDLVYLETFYNQKNNIKENSKHLNMLEYINDILELETPKSYFIVNCADRKSENKCVAIKVLSTKKNRFKISLSQNFDFSKLDRLSTSRIETFVLKQNNPLASQYTIIKTEKDGVFSFKKITKHQNIETEQEIDGKEYLKLTTSVNIDIPRISITEYQFLYKGHFYKIIINNKDNSAILETTTSNAIPDFVKVID